MRPTSIITISLVLGSLALAWFLVVPNVQNIMVMRNELVSEQEDLLVFQQTGVSVESAKRFYANLSESEKRLISLAAPASPDKHDLIIILNRFAEDNGLILKSITVDDSTKSEIVDDSLASVSASLELEGSYEAFKAFMKNVEDSLRIFDIDSVKIGAPDGGDITRLTFEVSGDAYYTPQ